MSKNNSQDNEMSTTSTLKLIYLAMKSEALILLLH